MAADSMPAGLCCYDCLGHEGEDKAGGVLTMVEKLNSVYGLSLRYLSKN